MDHPLYPGGAYKNIQLKDSINTRTQIIVLDGHRTHDTLRNATKKLKIKSKMSEVGVNGISSIPVSDNVGKPRLDRTYMKSHSNEISRTKLG